MTFARETDEDNVLNNRLNLVFSEYISVQYADGSSQDSWIQINGWVNDIMRVEPLADKWRAFGWNVVECDGHDMRSVLVAFHKARAKRGAPTVILAATVKGKGVSYMEDNNLWHGQAPNDAQTEVATRAIIIICCQLGLAIALPQRAVGVGRARGRYREVAIARSHKAVEVVAVDLNGPSAYGCNLDGVCAFSNDGDDFPADGAGASGGCVGDPCQGGLCHSRRQRHRHQYQSDGVQERRA